MHLESIRSRDDLRELKKILESKENVFQTGVGYREVGGEKTRQPALIASVEEKVPIEHLDSGQVIPKEIKGVPVDVKEKSKPRFLHAPVRDEQIRPILGGTTVSRHDLSQYGSIAFGGGFVDGDDDEVILSNAHVFIDNEDDIDEIIGEDVVQPGDSDAVIGVIKDAQYDPIDDSGQDWATVVLDEEDDYSPAIIGVGGFDGVGDPTFLDSIVLTGAAPEEDGLRHSRVEEFDVSITIESGGFPPGLAGEDGQFDGLIEFGPEADNGDSGSVILIYDIFEDAYYIVGLVFAGSDDASYAIPIQDVMDKAGLSLKDDLEPEVDLPEGTDAFVESTVVYTRTGGQISVLVSNLSTETFSRSIELSDDEGTIAEYDVDLEQEEFVITEPTVLRRGSITLDSGDTTEDLDTLVQPEMIEFLNDVEEFYISKEGLWIVPTEMMRSEDGEWVEV